MEVDATATATAAKMPGVLGSPAVRRHFFPVLGGLVQIMLLVFFAVFADYRSDLGTSDGGVQAYYPMFQDTHIMIYIGFGFLMTVFSRYGMTAQGLNFFTAALTMQWAILVNNFFHQAWHGEFHKVHLSVQELIRGDFASGAVLISLGAVMGKVTKAQMLVVVLLEVIFYAVNESIGVINFEVVDMGGSIFVHTFGAYFGLGLTAALGVYNLGNAKTTKWNTLFSYIGTLFLFAYWPSFNGALAPNNTSSQHRVVINTVLSLTACVATTFFVSKYIRHGKFEADDLLNATLAGGVGVGSSSDLVVQPGGAIGIGIASGIVSTFGFAVLSGKLEKLGIQDVLGVHNLHGLPGLIGAFGGAISAAVADDVVYGDDIGSIFPARSEGRTASQQGGYQVLAVVVTIGIALLGGFITGKIIKRVPDRVAADSPYNMLDDNTYEPEAEHRDDPPTREEFEALRKALEAQKLLSNPLSAADEPPAAADAPGASKV